MHEQVKPNKSLPVKLCLWFLIASVVLGAILGIVFILRDTWGGFEVRVLLTSLVIAVASLFGLACDLSRTPRGRNLLPKLGLGLATGSALLMLIGIWGEVEGTLFWKMTSCVLIVSAATVHVCLLSIAKLAKRFQWVQFVSSQIAFGFALLLCAVVIAEIDSPSVWRLIAAASIVIGALSLTVPILHRISKLDRQGEDLSSPIQARNLAAIDDEIARLRKRIADLQQVRDTLEPEHRAGAADTESVLVPVSRPDALS